MKTLKHFILFSFIYLITSCILQFIPETAENPALLVVEGLITDQPGSNIIKLSSSKVPWEKDAEEPVTGCIVWISDDMGGDYYLQERIAGTYATDSASFRGTIGRIYTLHIRANTAYNNFNYESFPMELKSVPPIDSIYYEKVIIKDIYGIWPDVDGCQIYLDTHDPANNCNYYRWEYTEIWEFRLPWNIINQNCWIYENSSMINIKDISNLEESVINQYPLKFISNTTDRLKHKYCILVDQYSLNFDEYQYWEKVRFLTEDVGGLYDITPQAVPGNITCVEDPDEEVLGYFSVSSKSSKRFFIKDVFLGITNPYARCLEDTVHYYNISGVGVYVWILKEGPGYLIITNIRDCVDCTTRGTIVEPLFWKDGNN